MDYAAFINGSCFGNRLLVPPQKNVLKNPSLTYIVNV